MSNSASFSRRVAAAIKFALAGAIALGLTAFAACSSDESSGCSGQVVNGVCQAPCDPAKCVAPGSICNFQNECGAPCETNGNADCPLGQNCANQTYTDATGQKAEGFYCYTPEFGKNDGGIGQYEPCTDNAQCDVERGYTCIAGECRRSCAAHVDCLEVGYCDPATQSCIKTNPNDPYAACQAPEECNLAEGYDCVDNQCRLLCTNHNDCAGVGYCGDGLSANVPTKACIQAQFKAPYSPCQSSPECDIGGGYACVSGECRLVGCQTHEDCATIGFCGTGLDDQGQYVRACEKGTTYPDGQFGTKCVQGTECDTAAGFTCIGAGPGDVDAYCTQTGCQADTDCATGFFCSTVRTSRPPCQAACGLTASSTNCVPSADIGPGKEYSCGPISLLRNLCLKREYCNECETDADCLGEPNQFCVKDSAGAKRCTRICDPTTPGACPWGNASECNIWDAGLEMPGICNKGECYTCAHRFGACEGTGKSCEPCIDDADCPTGLCLSSDFTQERFCVDLTPSCDCTGLPTTQNTYCTGGGCPTTPGNLPMRCFGGPSIPATSVLLNKCYGANVAPPTGSAQTGCWPAQ
jgi:hypothetical protein